MVTKSKLERKTQRALLAKERRDGALLDEAITRIVELRAENEALKATVTRLSSNIDRLMDWESKMRKTLLKEAAEWHHTGHKDRNEPGCPWCEDRALAMARETDAKADESFERAQAKRDEAEEEK